MKPSPWEIAARAAPAGSVSEQAAVAADGISSRKRSWWHQAFRTAGIRRLAVVVIILWMVTFLVDSDAVTNSVASPIKSEGDAWIAVLSGGLLALAAIHLVANAWGTILVAATALLLFQLSLLRTDPIARWWIAAGGAILILFGVPAALNAHEEARLEQRFAAARTGSQLTLAGRAIEVRGRFDWQTCNHACLSLLLYGKARVVTQSIGGETTADAPSVAQSFILGPRTARCFPVIAGKCGHMVATALPKDRLIVEFRRYQAPRSFAPVVAMDTMKIRDLARPDHAVSRRFRLERHGFAAPLNPRWRNGAIIAPRDEFASPGSSANEESMLAELARHHRQPRRRFILF